MAFPPIKFVGPELQAAIASLQAGMPGQVTQYNAEPANTVDIETPATYHFGLADAHASYAFPQVEVAAPDGRFGNWAIGKTAADHDPNVNVVIWLQGTTGQVSPVYKQLLGMVRCALEVLVQHEAFGPGVEIAEENGIYWRLSEVIPLEMDDVNRVVKTWLVPALIQFRIEKVEQFG